MGARVAIDRSSERALSRGRRAGPGSAAGRTRRPPRWPSGRRRSRWPPMPGVAPPRRAAAPDPALAVQEEARPASPMIARRKEAEDRQVGVASEQRQRGQGGRDDQAHDADHHVAHEGVHRRAILAAGTQLASLPDAASKADPSIRMPDRTDTDGAGSTRWRGNMSVREAGRKGGKTTRARYGTEFFQEIGAKGGRTVSERYPSEHFREIGRKGGRRVAELIARAKEHRRGRLRSRSSAPPSRGRRRCGSRCAPRTRGGHPAVNSIPRSHFALFQKYVPGTIGAERIAVVRLERRAVVRPGQDAVRLHRGRQRDVRRCSRPRHGRSRTARRRSAAPPRRCG